MTRVGGVLRKTRIDEIPQLYNVFLGDMSLVGPRPEREHFVDQLSEDIPWFKQRHLVKPRHGMGADQLPLRQHDRRRSTEAPIRPLLHQILLAAL